MSILVMSLTTINPAQAQTINDFVNSDDLEKASIESVVKFNVPSFYKIMDLKVVSGSLFALVGSFVNPNDEGQTQKAWFGTYEDDKLVSQFEFGGEYWLQEDKPVVFRNTEFISIDYQRGYFYVLGNAEVLGLRSNVDYINASIEFSFSEDDMKVNLSNLRINPSSIGLAAVAIIDNYVVNGTIESTRIDYYVATSYLIGNVFKNTKISIMSSNLNVNTHIRLGPFVMDRPLNNSTDAVSFFFTPFGPMIIITDFEGDLQIHTFYTTSHKISPLGRAADFYVLKLDAVGLKESLVTAELGYTNNSILLNLNSYSYDFGKTLWVSNIWQNMTNIEFELDHFNNTVFLSTSAKNTEGITFLNIMHFNHNGKLKSEVNLGHHTLVGSFFTQNQLTLITQLDNRYALITIKIESISVIAQFVANLLKIFKKSNTISSIGIILILLLAVHEMRKRLEKADSTELYPVD